MQNKEEHSKTTYSDCPQNKFYHAPIPVAQDSVPIRINRCGAVEQTPREFYIHRDESYPYNAIHFVTSGTGRFTVGSTEYELKAGNIFLINAYEPHSYASDYNNPMGLLWIEFIGNDIHRLVRYITDRGSHVFSGDTELFSLCADVIIEVHKDTYKVSGSIYNILMELCEKTISNTTKQDYIQQNILSYIDENLHVNLSLHKISSHFGYNSNYFSERFKRMTGMNYNYYINKRRVAQACVMLEITDMSIGQIGINLGFYDTSHFIKRFQNIMGMSPAEYRKCYNIKSEKLKSHIQS